MNFENLSALMRSRRAVFPVSFTGEKVADEVVTSMLENANWAPSHKKTEPWRFIIFKDQSLEKLGDYLVNYYKENTPVEKQSDLKIKKTQNKTVKSSHAIAICMQRDPKESVPEWEEIAAVACAVQNLWLSASANGLGGYWSSPSSMINADEFLNLKEGERCLGIFYLGVPIEQLPTTSTRTPLEEKIRWF